MRSLTRSLPTSKGGTYEGDWVNRVPHGHGRMVYSDGSVYVGGWQDFKFHGHGKLVQKGGVVFEGEWRAGRLHGSGRVEATGYNNDAKHEGRNRPGDGGQGCTFKDSPPEG